VPLCRRHPGFLEEEQLTGAKIYLTDDEAMHTARAQNVKDPEA
jgi:hypothetical protein